MSKTALPANTVLSPVPAVMVSCGDAPENYNIVTVSWTGTVCSQPPMAYISLREDRHSFGIIRRTNEFVINLTPPELLETADWCGIKSGRDHDKWKERGLTPATSSAVKAPLIAECPVNVECRVTEVKHLGSHYLFLAEIAAIDADEKYVKDGRLDLSAFSTVANVGGKYMKVEGLIDPLRFTARK